MKVVPPDPTHSMLTVSDLTVSYGSVTAVENLSLQIETGKIVTLVGSNGAGKSTTLRALSGLVRSRAGRIVFRGEDITHAPPHRIVAAGLCHVPEGRMVFPNLTVSENLAMGAFLHPDRRVMGENQEWVFDTFPRLRERPSQLAGTLSGGEQQMLAIGRALMGQPRFLMLDEPSLGIAPRLVSLIFEKIVELNRKHGITLLLVEQNARLALEISHHAYVLESGRVTLSGPSSELRENARLKEAYLGG